MLEELQVLQVLPLEPFQESSQQQHPLPSLRPLPLLEDLGSSGLETRQQHENNRTSTTPLRLAPHGQTGLIKIPQIGFTGLILNGQGRLAQKTLPQGRK